MPSQPSANLNSEIPGITGSLKTLFVLRTIITLALIGAGIYVLEIGKEMLVTHISSGAATILFKIGSMVEITAGGFGAVVMATSVVIFYIAYKARPTINLNPSVGGDSPRGHHTSDTRNSDISVTGSSSTSSSTRREEGGDAESVTDHGDDGKGNTPAAERDGPREYTVSDSIDSDISLTTSASSGTASNARGNVPELVGVAVGDFHGNTHKDNVTRHYRKENAQSRNAFKPSTVVSEQQEAA